MRKYTAGESLLRRTTDPGSSVCLLQKKFVCKCCTVQDVMVHLNYFCRSMLFTSTSQMKALMYLRDTKHHHRSLLLQVDHTWMRVWMHHPTHQLVQALINMLRPHINLFKTPFTCTTTTAIDKVELYAQEMLTLGLLFTEFKDAIRWGGGERVFLCWKFFLPIFRAARKSNYAIEAITYLAEASVLLPPRLREQLLWSRFVNATGREGGNIVADLHMEHLNRTVKGALGNQFSNLHSGAILQTGRICGLLNSVCSVFDTQSSVAKTSTSHCSPRFESDLNKIIQHLMNSEVFRTKSGRFHRHFTKLSSPLTAHLHLKKDDFIKWLQDHFKKIIP